jgi:hypothetical protein
VNKENEQVRTSKRETVEAGGSDSESARRITRDELGRVARADTEAGRSEYDVEGRYNREAEALTRLSRNDAVGVKI